MLNGMLNSKKVSKDHIAEHRFDSYNKSRKYINHLNNLYELQLDKCAYDQSLVDNQLFKKQIPNSLKKPSLLPTSPVSEKILQKIRLLNIFQNLSETRIKKNLNKVKQTTPIRRKAHSKYFESRKYSELLIRLKNTRGFNEDFDSGLHGLNTNRNFSEQKRGSFLTDQSTMKTARNFDGEQERVSNQVNISEKIMKKAIDFKPSFFISEQTFIPGSQSPECPSLDTGSLSIFRFPSLKRSTPRYRKK